MVFGEIRLGRGRVNGPGSGVRRTGEMGQGDEARGLAMTSRVLLPFEPRGTVAQAPWRQVRGHAFPAWGGGWQGPVLALQCREVWQVRIAQSSHTGREDCPSGRVAGPV